MSGPVIVAVLAGSACWVGLVSAPLVVTHRSTASPPPPAWLVVVASLLVGALVTVVVGGRRFGFAAAAALAVMAVRRLVRDARRRREKRQTHVAVTAWCDAFAAELRAGLPTAHAVVLSCGDDPRWTAIRSTAQLSGDVAGALRTTAARPGARGLRAVAAAWDVSERSGAALAEIVERVAAGLRDELDAAAEVATAMAPARATAKMLAALPLFGMGLGMSMGAHPLAFLLGSEGGLVCLGVGLGLALVGVFWVEHLADRIDL